MKPSLNHQVLKHVNLNCPYIFHGFLLYYCSLSSIINSISLYMFVNLVLYSIFALRKAKFYRNIYATISFKSVVCFLKIITKFLLFRPFGKLNQCLQPTYRAHPKELTANIFTGRTSRYCRKESTFPTEILFIPVLKF